MNSENTDINIKSDICKHIHKVSVCFFIDCHFSLLISTSLEISDNYKEKYGVKCQIVDKCGNQNCCNLYPWLVWWESVKSCWDHNPLDIFIIPIGMCQHNCLLLAITWTHNGKYKSKMSSIVFAGYHHHQSWKQ